MGIYRPFAAKGAKNNRRQYAVPLLSFFTRFQEKEDPMNPLLMFTENLGNALNEIYSAIADLRVALGSL